VILSAAANLQTLSARFPPLSDRQFRQSFRQEERPPHLGHHARVCRVRHALTAVELGRGISGSHFDAWTIEAVGGTGNHPSGRGHHPPMLFEQFHDLETVPMRVPIVDSGPIPRHTEKTTRRGCSSQAR
jgi:hypothetical protein